MTSAQRLTFKSLEDKRMKYVSTRGTAPALSFREALLAGLAQDGGLYVPETWPSFSDVQIRAFQGMSYVDVAFQVISAFVDGEIDDAPLKAMIDEAYATFHHPAVAPLVQIGPNDWLLEIFHGPTLAFKDVAMQILARLMDHVLTEQGERLTIVGATSGDTGGAALEAFKSCKGIDTFFMYPHGRVSDVQRRQMTTVGADNAFALAIDGSFDDCQNMVKAMFAHDDFRSSVHLSAVNSINWGRVMAQTVYYFTAAAALGAPDRAVSFTVPTGNFGDIFAGYVAKKMGLPTDKLIIATNENNILHRTLQTGSYLVDSSVQATVTPSMDILISSNFERLLFEAVGRDAQKVSNLMGQLKEEGSYTLPSEAHAYIVNFFASGFATQVEIKSAMKKTFDAMGYVPDPHTAVGIHVAGNFSDSASPMITLATAHPAKFPDTVLEATGQVSSIPDWAIERAANAEQITRLPNDQAAVEEFIKANSRIGAGKNME